MSCRRTRRRQNRRLRGVDLISQGQQLLVGGNVAHVVAVVNVARHTGLVNQHLGRHPAQLEQVHFLPVKLQHTRIRVGQADERQRMFGEVGRKRPGVFGANHDDFDVARDKLAVILAQLRHVRAAERSSEGANEDQQDVLVTAEIGQTDGVAAIVGQAEVGRDLVEGDT